MPEKKNIITNSQYLKKGGIPRTADKVAIVGCAETTKNMVENLFGQEGWEYWGLNTLHKTHPKLLPKATRWFQMHNKHRAIDNKGDYQHWEWLKKQTNFPIYMHRQYEEVPMSIPFPKDEILGVQNFNKYFTNSISWQIALAIYENFKVIHLYGIEMALSSEYGYQRPSVEYFIGLAKGAGIEVFIPNRSDLLKTITLYGFEDHSVIKSKLREQKKEFKERTTMLSQMKEKLMAERNACFGAIQTIDRLKLDKTKITKPSYEELVKRMKEMQAKEQEVMGQILVVKGGNETIDYIERCWMHEPRYVEGE